MTMFCVKIINFDTHAKDNKISFYYYQLNLNSIL